MSTIDMSRIDGLLTEKPLNELAARFSPRSMRRRGDIHRLTGYMQDGAEQTASSIIDLSGRILAYNRAFPDADEYRDKLSGARAMKTGTLVPEEGTPVYYDQCDRSFQVLGRQVSNSEQEFWSLTIIRMSAYTVKESGVEEIEGSVVWYIELDETVEDEDRRTTSTRYSLLSPSKKDAPYVSDFFVRGTWKSKPLSEHEAKIRLAYLLS